MEEKIRHLGSKEGKWWVFLRQSLKQAVCSPGKVEEREEKIPSPCNHPELLDRARLRISPVSGLSNYMKIPVLFSMNLIWIYCVAYTAKSTFLGSRISRIQ